LNLPSGLLSRFVFHRIKRCVYLPFKLRGYI
jgi:hypothetical protein